MAKSKISGYIGYVLVLLVVIAVVGIIAHFTNGFTSDFKTFYVTVEGKDVMDRSGGYEATQTKPLEVDVKYTFGKLTGGDKGYTVKIVPNKAEDKNFDFTVDGATYSFFAEKDISAGFIIQKNEDSFSITPRGGTLTEILQAVYANKNVCDCNEFTYADMFTALITSYNGESAVEICFSITSMAERVTLDQGVMVF